MNQRTTKKEKKLFVEKKRIAFREIKNAFI